MIFGEHVFDEIRDTWIVDQEHPHRNRRKLSPPEIDELRVIIEVSFRTSLRVEEGRQTSFAVAVLPRRKEEQEALLKGRSQVILSFTEELPLSEDSLTRLSTAFDPSISCLLVDWERRSAEKGVIWGVMFFDERISRFESIPVGIEGLITNRPDVLTVTSLSPASLILSRGDAQIGRFVLGDFMPATPNPLAVGAMGNHILARLANAELYQRHENRFWFLFRDSLDYLLGEVSRRGHGSSVIVCPNSSADGLERDWRAGYTVNGELSIRQILGQVLDNELQKPPSMSGVSTMLLDNIALHRLLKTRLGFVAQLAAADGALLLTENLEPLAFAAKLDAPEWSGKVTVGPDGFGGGGEPFDLSLHGMRHNSTARFLGVHPEAFGFVISQDGPIRGMFRQNDNTILVWRDCRVSMFIQ